MKQSNSVRRYWCGAWLGFVLFIYFSLYSYLATELNKSGIPFPLLSKIFMYTSIIFLSTMIVLPPWSKSPSQSVTNFYIIGAIIISIGFGLIGSLLPILWILLNH